MNKIEQIKAEIERRYSLYGGGHIPEEEYAVDAVMEELDELLAFIATLDEQPSEDLELASQRSAVLHYEMSTDIDKSMKAVEARIFHEIGFKAGAKWDREKVIGIIEKRISEILGDAQPKPALRYELMDIVKRIKKD